MIYLQYVRSELKKKQQQQNTKAATWIVLLLDWSRLAPPLLLSNLMLS